MRFKRSGAFILLILPLTVFAQISRLGEDVQYLASSRGSFSAGTYAPFWFTSNQYGLSSAANNSGYLRAAIGRDAVSDSLRRWRFGYGADFVVPFGMNRSFVCQQLYADIQWRGIRLSLGQKERPLELRNQSLSSGNMTTGINARPLPQVRVEFPDFLTVPFFHDWLSIKGHLAYGWYTDNRWQREFVSSTQHTYTQNSRYHSKAAFLRIGREATLPLFLTLGFEMSCQFDGVGYMLTDRMDHHDDTFSRTQDLGHGFMSYLHAFIPAGRDVNDGSFSNMEGNHLGSYHLRLDYHAHDWKAAFYMEHFYEDHSQLFLQYGWKDMTYGLEIQLPRNRFLSNIVYEHLRTTDQSGPIYHDATSNMPIQMSGRDQYYTHHIYGAWQHAGFVMGNPLLISPLYDVNGHITVLHNRVMVNHLALSGNPFPCLDWRVLYTHERSLGDYQNPLPSPESANYLLLETTFRPSALPGISVSAAYGHNDGEILGSSNGAMLTFTYTGKIGKKKY